jgi:hypothetical protein
MKSSSHNNNQQSLDLKSYLLTTATNAGLLLCIIFLLAANPAGAQDFSVSGRVFDAFSGEPLAFVNIVSNNSYSGTATDIDGRFSISSSQKINSLRLSYVGYKPTTFPVEEKTNNLKIYLEKENVELEEVVIVAGENPAHRIIRNVMANREKNNPDNISTFSYKSYDKMVFTVDTLEQEPVDPAPGDSSYIRLKNFLSDKDLFMMETVSERRYMAPDRNHEKVLASRISGLQDPVLLFLGSQLQSSTFYNELIEIAGKKYINPISRGSLRKYYFQLEDTTYTPRGDSVFIISFRPGANTNFDGLKGVLSINNFGWAIQNVLAEPWRNDENTTVKIRQLYQLINDSIWFVSQLNTDIIFNNVSVNGVIPVGKGRSYIRDIVLHPELVKRQFNQVSIEFHPEAGNREEEFWMYYRGDSLNRRELRTYEFLDSLGKEANLDNMVFTIRSLLNNRLPLGKLDLDLSKIARYNDYEGLYLGLGLLTSPRLSQTINAGAYWGYGFGDKSAKYGGNISLTVDKYRELEIQMAISDDVTETGGVKFHGESAGVLNPSNYRYLLVKRMDRTQNKYAGLSFRAFRYGKINVGIDHNSEQVFGDYYFTPSDSALPERGPTYVFAAFKAGIRYAYKENFLQMPGSNISLGTDYPIVTFQYTRGIEGFLDGEFSYNKYDLKIESKRFFKYLGESKLILMAGYVNSSIPQTDLYNGRGAYRPFTIFAPNSFVTQRMNEFLSDRYLFLFYTHNFGKLLWRGKTFSPEFALATNFGIGALANQEYHQGINFKIMDRGYLESGLLINNLLNIGNFLSMGVTAHYRYGYYSLPQFEDNLALRFSMEFPF